MNKYKLTDETLEWGGRTLYRIEALVDFWDVKAGDKGGWIEREENLSQDGVAWIYDEAKVYGNAQVYGQADVRDYAKVCGYAQVFGNSRVFGSAQVMDNAKVYNNARIYGYAKVYDDAQVFGNAEVFGYTQVYGYSVINGMCVGCDMKICENGSYSINNHSQEEPQNISAPSQEEKDFIKQCAIEAMQGIQESGKLGIAFDIVPHELAILSFDIAECMWKEYQKRFINKD